MTINIQKKGMELKYGLNNQSKREDYEKVIDNLEHKITDLSEELFGAKGRIFSLEEDLEKIKSKPGIEERLDLLEKQMEDNEDLKDKMDVLATLWCRDIFTNLGENSKMEILDEQGFYINWDIKV